MNESEQRVYIVYGYKDNGFNNCLDLYIHSIWTDLSKAREYIENYTVVRSSIRNSGSSEVPHELYVIDRRIDNKVGCTPVLVYRVTYDRYLEAIYCDYLLTHKENIEQGMLEDNENVYYSYSIASVDNAIEKLNLKCRSVVLNLLDF